MSYIVSTMFKCLLIVAIAILSVNIQAKEYAPLPVVPKQQLQAHSYLTHKLVDNQLIVTTNLGDIHFSAYHPDSFEVLFNAKQQKLPADDLASFAIKESAVKQAVTLTSTNNKLTLSAGRIQAEITKQPFTIKYFYQQRLLIEQAQGFFSSQIQEDNKTIAVHGVNFKLNDNEQLLGGGQRVLGMDRRGHRMPLYNRAHYGYQTSSNQMNYSLPAVMSSNKYIVLFDNSAKGWLDIAKSKAQVLQFEAVAGRNAYIIVGGNNYPELIENYVDITGKQPMPPRWALGNFASRFGYHSEQEVRDTVAKFKTLDIPLDAVILDLYWFGKDIKGHMGNLAWDKQAFPTPTKMITDLAKDGVKTIMITEPFVLSSSSKWQDAVNQGVLAKDGTGKAKQFDFYFGNTGLIDVFNQQGRNWFNQAYNMLDKQGVSGWWGDLGEPEVHPANILHRLDNGAIVSGDAIHNAYGHQWAKMVYDNHQASHPNSRPFILMRSGFAGSQRYGMLPWTGDVSRSWGGLQPQVELSLQMGLLGLAYTHSDLGGFAGGEQFDAELYTRWLQYGVFQPIYRPHGQEHIASEVVFHDKQTQDIVRQFINLRYQLLPYHYTMAYQNSTSGIPLMRPLFFEKGKTEQNLNNTSSYLWGDAFFVQPIVNPNIKVVKVKLPQGLWFNYFTNEKYVGGQEITQPVSIKTIPVFVRAGAFIPTIETISTTADYDSKKITLHYYADQSVTKAEGQMYEDDGISLNAIEQNQYELLKFSAQHENKQLNISFKRLGGSYQGMPTSREIELIIHNWCQQPGAISFAQKSISQYQWQADSCMLTIPLNWQHQPATIKIN